MEVVVAYSHCVRELGIVCLGDQLTVKHRNLMKPLLYCVITHTQCLITGTDLGLRAEATSTPSWWGRGMVPT